MKFVILLLVSAFVGTSMCQGRESQQEPGLLDYYDYVQKPKHEQMNQRYNPRDPFSRITPSLKPTKSSEGFIPSSWLERLNNWKSSATEPKDKLMHLREHPRDPFSRLGAKSTQEMRIKHIKPAANMQKVSSSGYKGVVRK
jgi:hypothetical protein